MDSKTLSQLERNINAERIASVISHPKGHSFKKHQGEFNNDIGAYRQAIIDTLMDPETLVTKSSIGYVFFGRKDGQPEDNVIVLIDPASSDWGTAFKPDGDRGMKFLREKGVPINRNADVNYLNKMNPGFFAQQERLRQSPEPVRLSGLTRVQISEVMLSLFDRMDNAERSGGSLQNSFDMARANIMPDMARKIRDCTPEQKNVLRQSAHLYKDSMSSQFETLQGIDARLMLKGGMKAGALATMLRDPGWGEVFLSGLEERFAMAETAEDTEKLAKAIEACETFSRYEVIRRDALERAADIMDQLRPQPTQEFNRVATSTGKNIIPGLQISRPQSI